ncbi:MAG: ankyrin repeat domain-containing protein [Rickettsiaceae bacterium]|nr:ankyrin repeat domain-containing protein [Rickettsiaceae bacterium]
MHKKCSAFKEAVNCITQDSIGSTNNTDKFVTLLKTYPGLATKQYSKSKKSLLHVAAINGHVDIVKILIKYGADVNKQDVWGHTSLYYAAGCGHVNIVGILVENNANVNTKDPCSGSILHAAAYNGHVDIIKILIENHNTNIHIEDKYGLTALHYAAINGHNAIVKLLVTYGADVNKQDNFGCTPRHYAIAHGYKDIKFNSKQVVDKTSACAHVQSCPQQPDNIKQEANAIVEPVITYGADVNKQDNFGCTPRHYAIAHGDKDIKFNSKQVVNKTSACAHVQSCPHQPDNIKQQADAQETDSQEANCLLFEIWYFAFNKLLQLVSGNKHQPLVQAEQTRPSDTPQNPSNQDDHTVHHNNRHLPEADRNHSIFLFLFTTFVDLGSTISALLNKYVRYPQTVNCTVNHDNADHNKLTDKNFVTIDQNCVSNQNDIIICNQMGDLNTSDKSIILIDLH